jgi:hypothetical protein
MRMLSSLVAISLTVTFAVGGGSARAEKINEPSSGVGFDSQKTVDGKAYTLVGAGIRKKFGFKVYAMGLYLENVDAKRAFPSLAQKAGGTSKEQLAAGDRAQSFIVWGSFDKIGVMHFVRDVGSEKIRDAFQEGFEEQLSDKAPTDVRDATNAFLKMVDRDLKSGDELILHTNGDGKIDMSIGGQNKGSVQNVKLARALWNVWLGSKPVTADLKRDLVNRIDELGK